MPDRQLRKALCPRHLEPEPSGQCRRETDAVF